MRGHIRQRGDTWELRAYVGRDPVTGRKKYLTRTFRGGKRLPKRRSPSLWLKSAVRSSLIARVRSG